MNVRELIAELQKVVDKDAQVYYNNPDGDDYEVGEVIDCSDEGDFNFVVIR